MTIGRTKESISKAEDAGTAHVKIRFSDALRRVLPTRLTSYSNFVAGFARRPCVTEVQQHHI